MLIVYVYGLRHADSHLKRKPSSKKRKLNEFDVKGKTAVYV